MRAFRVEYIFGFASPRFDGDDAEAWVREAFLREANGLMSQMLDAIWAARNGQREADPSSGDHVCFQADPDGLTVIAHWIADDRGNPCVIRMPLDEAEQLLLQWREIPFKQTGK